MDDVSLERRFGLIEAAQQAAITASITNHSAVLLALGRIDQKIETQNSNVAKHEKALLLHSLVPHSGVPSEESLILIKELQEMWAVWKIGRYVLSAVALTVLGQMGAIITLVLRG